MTTDTDIVIPFPSPRHGGGMCWPPRRASPPTTEQMNTARIEQLRCAVDAMAPRDARPAGPPMLRTLLDSEDVQREDGTLASPGEAFQMGREIGLAQGERRAFPRGWCWGLLCGVVLMIALAGAVVTVFGSAGYATAERVLQHQYSLPSGRRPQT